MTAIFKGGTYVANFDLGLLLCVPVRKFRKSVSIKMKSGCWTSVYKIQKMEMLCNSDANKILTLLAIFMHMYE